MREPNPKLRVGIKPLGSNIPINTWFPAIKISGSVNIQCGSSPWVGKPPRVSGQVGATWPHLNRVNIQCGSSPWVGKPPRVSGQVGATWPHLNRVNIQCGSSPWVGKPPRVSGQVGATWPHLNS